MFTTSADCCVITCCAMLYYATTRAYRCEVSNVQRTVMARSTLHVAMNGLLPCMMASRMMMEPSLIEVVGSNLAECVLVFSRTCSKIASVALMYWVTCTSRCSLLPQLSLGNRLRYRSISMSTAHHHGIVTSGIEELSSHHHLLLICVGIWCFTLVDQIE